MHRILTKFYNAQPIWLIVRQLRKIWVRAAGFAVLAIASVALAQWLGSLVPVNLTTRLGVGAVDQVLTILASSMLAVTTFSVSISVSAFGSAASSATPRATALLKEDRTTQNVLATFLGAFLFSLVGIVALNAGYYSEGGRLVLFATTFLVIALVVVSLIRWISHLTDFGRLPDTLDRVEDASCAAFTTRMQAPWLGGNPLTDPPPASARPICADAIGYIQHIDMEALSQTANDLEATIWLAALPGAFVHTAAPLLHIESQQVDDETYARLQSAFITDRDRNFEQDPLFGLTVMSEIASRALSPAVNDPGTAINVLGRMVRILSVWRADVDARLDYPNIYVPSLTVDELLDVALRPIARDGAAIIEVHLKIQQILHALSEIDASTFAASTKAWSRTARACAEQGNANTAELKILEAACLSSKN